MTPDEAAAKAREIHGVLERAWIAQGTPPRPNRKQRRAAMKEHDFRDLGNHNVPDLSAPKFGRVTAPLALFMRQVGPDGTTLAPIVNGQGTLQRDQYLDAGELVNEIVGANRQMVREELVKFASWLTETLGVTPPEPVPDNVVPFPARAEAEPTA